MRSATSPVFNSFFFQVMQSDEFLLLSKEQLIGIISSDEINVRNEEQVFNAVMQWVKYDLTNRRVFLSQVLGNVRLV